MDKPSTSLTPPVYRPNRTFAKRLEAFLGRDWRIAAIFVLPVVIIMAGLIFWPFIDALWTSMTVRSFLTGQESFVGLRNYVRLFSDSDYIGSLRVTIWFTVGSLSVKFVVGMAIALLLNSRLPARGLLTGLMLLPWIAPEVVTALAWRSIYDPIFGGLNPILQAMGIIDKPQAWLSDPRLAMPSVIAVNVWKGIPFYTILLLAGLKSIPSELNEAAEVDGASVVQRFRHITLPSLRYVIAVTLLLSFISTFNTFGLIFLMTGGGPGGATRVYSVLAYEKAIIGLRFGPGIATAFSMAPLMTIFIFFLSRFMLGSPDAKPGKVKRRNVLGVWLGRGVGALLDLIFWPFEKLEAGLGGLFKGLRRALRGTDTPLKRAERERLGVRVRLLCLLPMVIFVLFPFYWILITSFKTDLQIQQFASIFWPRPWTWEQIRSLMFDTPFLLWFRNTVFIATVSTAISVVLAAMAAYALARFRFLGAGALTTLLLVTYLLPSTLIFIPLYQTLVTLGIINTYAALIVTYPTFLLPFSTWVMLGYFRSIPVELEEAALIDGANRFGAFWRITLPLSAPALLSVTLFAFTNAWNEFLFALVFITSERLKTLPVGLQLLVHGDVYPWGQLMAASLLMAIPVMLVYVYAQRYLVEGLTLGSVKG